MNADKVIEVLEWLYNDNRGVIGHNKIEYDNVEISQACSQAISLIKENADLLSNYEVSREELRLTQAENDELRSVNKVYLSDMVDKGNEIYKLQQELTELRKELKNTREASWEIQRQNRELQQELNDLKAKYDEVEKELQDNETDYHKIVDQDSRLILKLKQERDELKKAVDSEGLGFEEIIDVICNNGGCMESETKLAKAIHEAQTKYKKELKEG